MTCTIYILTPSINRNIVECKLIRCALEKHALNIVLIETLWNVNEKRERKVENAGYGINRNIVECKSVFV